MSQALWVRFVISWRIWLPCAFALAHFRRLYHLFCGLCRIGGPIYSTLACLQTDADFFGTAAKTILEAGKQVEHLMRIYRHFRMAGGPHRSIGRFLV